MSITNEMLMDDNLIYEADVVDSNSENVDHNGNMSTPMVDAEDDVAQFATQCSKSKRNLHRFTAEHREELQRLFAMHRFYPPAALHAELATKFNIDKEKVRVWFQNKRHSVKNLILNLKLDIEWSLKKLKVTPEEAKVFTESSNFSSHAPHSTAKVDLEKLRELAWSIAYRSLSMSQKRALDIKSTAAAGAGAGAFPRNPASSMSAPAATFGLKGTTASVSSPAALSTSAASFGAFSSSPATASSSTSAAYSHVVAALLQSAHLQQQQQQQQQQRQQQQQQQQHIGGSSGDWSNVISASGGRNASSPGTYLAGHVLPSSYSNNQYATLQLPAGAVQQAAPMAATSTTANQSHVGTSIPQGQAGANQISDVAQNFLATIARAGNLNNMQCTPSELISLLSHITAPTPTPTPQAAQHAAVTPEQAASALLALLGEQQALLKTNSQPNGFQSFSLPSSGASTPRTSLCHSPNPMKSEIMSTSGGQMLHGVSSEPSRMSLSSDRATGDQNMRGFSMSRQMSDHTSATQQAHQVASHISPAREDPGAFLARSELGLVAHGANASAGEASMLPFPALDANESRVSFGVGGNAHDGLLLQRD